MNTEYEGVLGIVVRHDWTPRGRPISAFLIGHVNASIEEHLVGLSVNNNMESNVKLLKPVEKSIEELMDGYVVSGRCCHLDDLCDMMDYLNWLGYAYVMKNYPPQLPGKPPLLIISNPSVVDLDKWSEISTESIIREINNRTNIVGIQ